MRVAATVAAVAFGAAVGMTGIASLLGSDAGPDYYEDFARPNTNIEVVANHIPDPLDGEIDVTTHVRDAGWMYDAPDVHAEHGADCSAPPATHLVTGYEGQVFLCGSGANSHLMTAVNGAAGYGLVALTLPVLMDFRDGATLKFDVSTKRTCDRDWWDVWITPYEGNVTEPVHWLIGTQGYPSRSLHIRSFYPQSFFAAKLHLGGPTGRDFVSDFSTDNDGVGNYTGYETVLTPSATVRSTFQLDLSPTHVKFFMPDEGITWVDDTIPDLGFDQGIVQLVHHSYTPGKVGCEPNTFHWDNISIDHATRFRMIHADRRYVDGNGQTVTFTRPAPANSSLRFTARGNVEVSYDGGSSWHFADHQPIHVDESWASYFTFIPEGVQQVKFRFTPRGGVPSMARDFAIWSLTEVPPSTPTPSTSPSATASPSPLPSSTPTVIPSPVPTNTTPASATPMPTTPTATATTAVTPPPTSVPTTASPTPLPILRACTVRWGNNTVWNYGRLTLEECQRIARDGP